MWDRLAVHLVLEGDFCDRFVVAIRPLTRTVELDYGNVINIFRMFHLRSDKVCLIHEGNGEIKPKEE